ncbi:hypothetical protein FJT64_013343 [Amphibalanus amphitrite]|uniref:Cytochrome c oxidase polypeptide VIII n=1 Tax=Amphibalanus amphitrite TaxID=1232801 RepID=A0A6A4V372_AMPAM|nr:hypothetical protein FJT64_013343 [Amphibalanus amphitrite]
MMSLTGSLVRLVPAAARAQARSYVVSGPPRVRMSRAEKFAHGVVLFGGVMAVPAWILVHIKDYRGALDE